MRQILWGLFKKIVIADNCAIYANEIFNNSGEYSGSTMVLGAVFFAFQIYGDFSGYSDIAIGTSRLFGFNLMRNFNYPYFSRDIAEFWRRWHISLSTWLRDYLYIPLGGNRGSSWATYRNLAITMLLGGLWHGASWTFVIWGAGHGIALGVVRFIQRRRDPSYEPTLARQIFAGILTFEFVNLLWVVFRAPTWSDAQQFLGRLFEGSSYAPNLTLPVFLALSAGIAMHITPLRWKDGLMERFVALPAWAKGLAVAAVAIALQHIKGADAVPFIYFQF